MPKDIQMAEKPNFQGQEVMLEEIVDKRYPNLNQHHKKGPKKNRRK